MSELLNYRYFPYSILDKEKTDFSPAASTCHTQKMPTEKLQNVCFNRHPCDNKISLAFFSLNIHHGET